MAALFLKLNVDIRTFFNERLIIYSINQIILSSLNNILDDCFLELLSYPYTIPYLDLGCPPRHVLHHHPLGDQPGS